MKSFVALKKHFARAARKIVILATGILLSTTALAQDTRDKELPAPKDSIEMVMSPPAQAVPLDAVLEDFGRTQMGRDMLLLASMSGVSIAYDSSLVYGGAYAQYNAERNAVLIMPGAETSATSVFLAHELFHAWQQHYLDYYSLRGKLMPPEQRWDLCRYIEASAFAFSANFLADRMIQLEDESGVLPSPDIIREYAMAAYIIKERASADGLTLKEYRDNVLQESFAGLHDYNKAHEETAELVNQVFATLLMAANAKMDNGDYQGAEAILDDLCNGLSKAPDEQSFTQYLRRFGGISLDPAAATCLQDAAITDEIIFKGYPRLFDIFADGPGFPAVIESRLSKYNEVFDGLKATLTRLEKRLAEERPGAPLPPPAQPPSPKSLSPRL